MESSNCHDIKELIKLCRQSLRKAYCPYSKFAVGAAVLGNDGRIFTGCNVENAMYGLSMCAERVAIFKAISEGCKAFKAIAVSSLVKDEFVTPCGSCRQVLAEFGTSMEIYIIRSDDAVKKYVLKELLPHPFTPASLQLDRNEIK